MNYYDDELSGEERDIKDALSSIINHEPEDTDSELKLYDFITKDFSEDEISELVKLADFYEEVVYGTVNIGCDCGCGGDYYSDNYDDIKKGEKYLDKLVGRYRLYHIMNNTDKSSNYEIVNKTDDSTTDSYYIDYYTQKSGFSDFIKKVESKEFLESIK